MDTIGVQDLWSFLDGESQATVVRCDDVRRSRGIIVSDYLDLAQKVAELQFRNRDHVLMFRGQRSDYRDSNGRTSIRPSIFRSVQGQNTHALLEQRFPALERAERLLVDSYNDESLFLGGDEIKRYQILRWSIIQHYEIHDTPLLDVTHSLRVAASFASLENETGEAYLFVIGIPNLSGAITASAEAGIQTIRLSSVCPPSAMRPHVQEGYLLGEYPEIGTYSQKQLYGLPEIDFGRRLVAKFRFNPSSFWTKTGQFQAIGKSALFPSPSKDPIHKLADHIKKRIDRSW
ncbi:FRG domain-containing protein [Roseibium aggregatum]|uniref:FRG domain-containing protein n=1 Tax=Roseibium aggregatum TaxID=187304 RepID=UPI00094AFF4E|nr:FRG domain-containing protein [Roseibium aggregatum]UFI02146.1 FRG domain-containing protein [Roseibium aggregatum]